MNKELTLPIILITFLFSFSTCKVDNNISVELIKLETNETIYFDSIICKEISQIDLNLLVNKISYPPKIPKQFLWIMPDTTSMNILEKNEIFNKYRFNKKGKVTLYFYLGSFISGVLPQEYLFYYDSVKTELITEIVDIAEKEKYKIYYDESNNIKLIERIVFYNKKIEILIIKE